MCALGKTKDRNNKSRESGAGREANGVNDMARDSNDVSYVEREVNGFAKAKRVL